MPKIIEIGSIVPAEKTRLGSGHVKKLVDVVRQAMYLS